MNYLSMLYLVLMVISVGLIVLSSYCFIYKFKDNLYFFISILTFQVFIWVLFMFLIQVLQSDNSILFVHEAKYISILTLPLTYFIFAYNLYYKKNISKTSIGLFTAVTIILFSLILINPNQLMRTDIYLTYSNLDIVSVNNGPLYYFIVGYVYILLIISVILLAGAYRKEQFFYRRQEGFLLLAASFPILANMIYQISIRFFHVDIDPTPLTFFTTITIYYFSLLFNKPTVLIKKARNHMISSMTIGSLFLDLNHRVFDGNLKILDLLSINKSDIVGKLINDIDLPLFKSITALLENESTQEVIYQDKSNSIHRFYLIKSDAVYDNKHHELGKLILLTDVTELQHTLNQLKYIGQHDDLTGVYNRYYFQKKLNDVDLPKYFPLAIVVGDINGLKYVNDTYGHASGDSLLVEAAEKLVHFFGKGSTVCRIGGDEFVIIVPNTEKQKLLFAIKQLEDYVFSYGSKEENIGISLDYAIKNDTSTDIYQLFKQADANMYLKKVLSGSSSRDNNVLLLQKILSGKSIETIQHLERTSYLSQQFALRLHLDHSALNDLLLLSQLHDIGKTVIPDNILFKPGSLTEEEWIIMKTHSIKGYDILCASPTLKGIATYVMHHHERYDGMGYPIGLKGEEIPYLCRIITIIDSYDAIISKRVYKEASSQKEALEELNRCSGSQFDPYLVKVFIEMITL